VVCALLFFVFRVSRADRAFRAWMEQRNLMEFVDPGRLYPTNRHAAAAFRAEAATAAAPERGGNS
jgi:hypothetical protein